MPYATFADDKEYLFSKYRTPVFDPTTGLDNDQIIEALDKLAEEVDPLPRPIGKARCFEFICKNMAIDVNPHDCFPFFACWDRNQRPMRKSISRWAHQVFEKRITGDKALADVDSYNRNVAGITTTWVDFDHSVPDWDAIISLGFPGLRDRARDYRRQRESNGTMTEDAKNYFEGLDITICAVIDCIGRFIDFARERHPDNPRIQKEIACLEQLRVGAPRDTYELLQLIYLFFMFGEHIDHMQVRSLGNLDQTLKPFIDKDIHDGHYTEAEICEYLACFLMQWGSINNYWGQPVYFGGTLADGSTGYSYVTHVLLDVYDKLDITSPKLQLKVDDNTPQDILEHALDMIRRGHNSIVFCGEPGMRRAMMGIGFTAEEARTCDIKGCYEFGPKAKYTDTGASHINLLKIVELVLNDGVDPQTGYVLHSDARKLADIHSFGDFHQAYLASVRAVVDAIITQVNNTEELLHEINPAQMYSITIQNSLETARDAFSNGSVYNNTTILICGLGTTVDAFMAIRHFVFDTHQVTLEKLRDILRANWAGHEEMRLEALHLPQKYGNNIAEVDEYAVAIMHYVASLINGKPNARGGFYMASGHCAKQFVVQGEKTGATPDGRLAGEEFSKNLSPTMGMDTNGVTAVVQSVCKLSNLDLPGDFPLDIMMHPSTVKGDAGLAAMQAVVMTYVHMNGCAIHFNIVDPEILEDAQVHPEKHEGLQIRVCGWSTRFTTMDKKEQDAYIKRAKSIIE